MAAIRNVLYCPEIISGHIAFYCRYAVFLAFEILMLTNHMGAYSEISCIDFNALTIHW